MGILLLSYLEQHGYQKQWPSKNYITALEKINLPAVLIGSKKDTICNEIAFGYKKTVNLAGQTDIRLASFDNFKR